MAFLLFRLSSATEKNIFVVNYIMLIMLKVVLIFWYLGYPDRNYKLWNILFCIL